MGFRLISYQLVLSVLALGIHAQEKTWTLEGTKKQAANFSKLKGDTRAEFELSFRKSAHADSKKAFLKIMQTNGPDLVNAVQAYGRLASTKEDVKQFEKFLLSDVVNKKMSDHDFLQICFVQIGYMSQRGLKDADLLFKKLKWPSFWRKRGVTGRDEKDYFTKENRIVYDLLVGYAWSKSPKFPKEAKEILKEIKDPEQKKLLEWRLKSISDYYDSILKMDSRRAKEDKE